MARWYLSFDDGLVKLGDTTLPGIYRRSDVRGQVTYDEAEQDGLSGKVKTPTGWEDADARIVLDLLSDDDSTCYDKLQEIHEIFTGVDSGGNPVVLGVQNSHLLARGINEVVFDGLSSRDTDRNDIVQATLTFKEHKPATQISETRAVAKQQAAGEQGEWNSQIAGGVHTGSGAPQINTPTTEPDAGMIVVDLEAAP